MIICSVPTRKRGSPELETSSLARSHTQLQGRRIVNSHRLTMIAVQYIHAKNYMFRWFLWISGLRACNQEILIYNVMLMELSPRAFNEIYVHITLSCAGSYLPGNIWLCRLTYVYTFTDLVKNHAYNLDFELFLNK